MATQKKPKSAVEIAKKMQKLRTQREAVEDKIKKLEESMQVLDKQLDGLIHEVMQCV